MPSLAPTNSNVSVNHNSVYQNNVDHNYLNRGLRLPSVQNNQPHVNVITNYQWDINGRRKKLPFDVQDHHGHMTFNMFVLF